jgi:hypothetical protein
VSGADFKLGLNFKNITAATIETVSKDYNTGITQIDKVHSNPQLLIWLEGKW